MCKIFFKLSVIMIVLFGTTDIFCQSNVSIDSVEVANFSNEFLLNGKTGKIFIVGSNGSLNNVVVQWNNGYFGIGTILEEKAFGKWSLFDKKNRLREYLMFGPDAKCILYSKKINRRGKIISEFKAITPCF